MKAALSNPDDKIDKLQGIMRKVFDRADTNRSGTLTTDEVRMPMTYLLSCRRGLSMVCCAGISLSEATWMERRYSSERVSVLGRWRQSQVTRVCLFVCMYVCMYVCLLALGFVDFINGDKFGFAFLHAAWVSRSSFIGASLRGNHE